jgi:YfiH family protein
MKPSSPPSHLCDPVLIMIGVEHGFGSRGAQAPEFTAFPRQVHGVRAVVAAPWAPDQAPDADAIVSSGEVPRVGIVTADCVPILLATIDGRTVAGIHAGWRGLAAGVIEAGVEAFLEASQPRDPNGPPGWVAAVGPAAGACCYEVDEPVREALAGRYGEQLDEEVLRPERKGRYQLDLPLLATRILEQMGPKSTRIGTIHRVCTICDPARFESFRRDGEAAGRLSHFIRAREVVSARVDSPGGPP